MSRFGRAFIKAFGKFMFEKEKAIRVKIREIIPSLLLIVMGIIDSVTTVIGVLFSGDKELNPFMAGVVSTNIGAFLIIKVVATLFIASTYISANRTLIKTKNKNTRSFRYSSKIIKVAYVGIMIFMIIVVANNLLVLLH